MIYKFLKFLFLSTLTLIWGGCESKDHAVAGYGCISTQCYNTTAVNDAGKVFDIIECENGDKYLRHPGIYESHLAPNDLPPDVYVFAPQQKPGAIGCGVTNCTYSEQDLCVDGVVLDEHGNEQPVGGCYPTINCPEKK